MSILFAVSSRWIGTVRHRGLHNPNQCVFSREGEKREVCTVGSGGSGGAGLPGHRSGGGGGRGGEIGRAGS